MRFGWVPSLVAHVGLALLAMRGCAEMKTEVPIVATNVVPIEITAVAPESNVRALALPQQEDNAPVQAEQTTPEPEPAPAPTPAPPIPKPPRPQQEAFNLDSVARMVDRSRQQGEQRHTGQTADRNQTGVGPGTAAAVALDDRVAAILQRQMLRCWRDPSDLPDPERLVVVVEFDLDRNGSLRGQPRVTSPAGGTSFNPAMRTAIDRAVRAVRQCDPYPFSTDPVLRDHYQSWSQLRHVFGLREN